MKVVLTILLCLVPALAQAPVTDQRRAIVTAWNECATSIGRENAYLLELQKSLQTSPPWRVLDAQAPGRRAELIDKVIAEHRKRIALLEKIKAEDQQ